MSSTRNNNSQAEYKLQTSMNHYIDNYPLYKHSTVPTIPRFAGNGLLPCKMGRNELSFESCDVESYLFGINSTNLVNPRAEHIPQFKQLQSLNIYKRGELVMPEPNIFSYNERPLLFK